MSFIELWAKLFTQKNKTAEIALHVSGATVRHRNPFENIEVPRNDAELTEEFVKKWVIPFYRTNLSNVDETLIKNFADTAKEINVKIVEQLLGDFNWRTRITGSFFAAINNYKGLEDIIGKHLLKSEVCYAGSGYCLALATFGSNNSKDYLTTYLDYYLERNDLWFDQAEAFCALQYIDISRAENLMSKWNSFVAGKNNWSLEKFQERFNHSMSTINKINLAKIVN
ncbi:DUF6000 family protein [Spirosoma gilvum]